MLEAADPRRVPDAPLRLSVDHARLAESLALLGYETRLALLDALRFPRSVAEIRLAPHRVVPGENADRAISKQAVQAHIDKLVEAGLVRADVAEEEGRAVNRYVVNAQHLYAVVEDLRSLCVRYAAHAAAGDATGTIGAVPRAPTTQGPRLVLVHGVYEGRSFPLDDSTLVDGRWVIGRRRENSIALDYDPFVSGEHATIARSGKGFVVTDVPASKNGTFVNWAPLPKGGSAPLRPADVVGVGRSLLSFAPG